MRFLILFSLIPLFIQSSAYAQDGDVKIQDAREEPYRNAPAISISLKKKRNIQYHYMILAPNFELGRGALKLRKFPKAFLKKGDVLEFNSYLIADRMRNAHRSGEGAPTTLAIQDALNSEDTDRFVRMLKKLSEQRRGAATRDELIKSANGLGMDPENPLVLDYLALNDYLYGTGFIEVSAKKLKKADPKLLYYIPASAILDGTVKLDLKNAKLQVLQSLALHLFQSIEGGEAFTEEVKPLRDGCFASDCDTQKNAPFGDLAVSLLDISKLELEEEATDSNAEARARIARRKQLCILDLLYSTCSSFPARTKIAASMQKEAIDCSKPETILIP